MERLGDRHVVSCSAGPFPAVCDSAVDFFTLSHVHEKHKATSSGLPLTHITLLLACETEAACRSHKKQQQQKQQPHQEQQQQLQQEQQH